MGNSIFGNAIFIYVVLGVVLSLLLSAVFMWLLSCVVASYCVYTKTLKRKDKEQWGRNIPQDIDPEQKPMYEAGLAWSAENAEYKTDVHIVNEGYNLYGEYYDFNKNKCAIIFSGRTECLKYGYYFAIPYANNDYNILVLDQRGHGLSDGEYNTVGFEEHKDAIAWVKYIKANFDVESFVFHGICIGAATGMFGLNSPDMPDCVDAIITEGMFANFYESVKNHLIEKKKSTFLTMDLINFWMKHFTGHSMKYGPINIIDNVKTPLLMLHSKEDLYSTPDFAEKLFEKSGADLKRIVWFEKGRHSMLRVTDTALYDTSISNFLAEVSANKNKTNKEKNYVL